MDVNRPSTASHVGTIKAMRNRLSSASTDNNPEEYLASPAFSGKNNSNNATTMKLRRSRRNSAAAGITAAVYDAKQW